eukprot:10695545-Ditylum_brightwellii.AAC.1
MHMNQVIINSALKTRLLKKEVRKNKKTISGLQKSKRDNKREIASLRKQLCELDDWKSSHKSNNKEHEQVDQEKSLDFQKEKLRVDLEKK